MPYGILKVDTVTFTSSGVDKSVTLSGLVQNPTFSGTVTSTSTISGVTIQGGTLVSGATVTGSVGQFTSLTAGTVTLTSGVFASGTAAAPSVSIGTSTNGIYSPGANQLAISTGGTGRLFVASDGKVGIGGSPSFNLDVFNTAGTGNQTSLRLYRNTAGVGDQNALLWQSSTLTTASISDYIESGTAAGLIVKTASGSTLLERARIDSSGRLLVGTSAARTLATYGSAGLQVESTAFTQASISAVNNQNTADGVALMLGKSRGTALGSFTVVQSGDQIGGIFFQGADGAAMRSGSSVVAFVDGTPGLSDMPGRLVFSTTADGSASPTERMRIDSSGRVLVGTTSAVAAGAKLQTLDGITFPAVQVASADPNTLDDYEEGTWTPVVTGWTSIAYANQVGNYVKIGRQVTAWFYLGFTGTSSASAVTITGLPFTVATRFNGGAITYHDVPTDETGGINIFPTGTTISFYADNDTAAVIQSNANITTTKFLVGSVTYAV